MVPKRFLTLLALFVVLSALMVVASSASAAPNAPFTTEIVRGTVNWTIPADQCAELPAGLALSGTGKRFQALSTKLKANGNTLTMSNDFVNGTASDGVGGTYTFVYSNQARYTVPPGSDTTFVNMTDTFILDNTNGENDFNVAFQWTWEFTAPDGEWPPNDNWVQNLTIGDPLTCDPI